MQYIYIFAGILAHEHMYTSVLAQADFFPEKHMWGLVQVKPMQPTQRVELSIWSLLSLSFLFAVMLIFILHVQLTVPTAMLLTTLYSFICMLISNEFMLSDWHTTSH
jgi:hypothetical protein